VDEVTAYNPRLQENDMNAVLATLFLFALQNVAPATATYRHDGPALLNDLTVTPGATGTTPVATLCSPDFHTGTIRDVTDEMKIQVCAEYGIAKEDCTGEKYEIDHLISLELGGSNGLKNLWPQPYGPVPGAREKDQVEDELHRQVCAETTDDARQQKLQEVQKEISTDWYTVYQTLPHPAKKQAPDSER
jgi:hypothetical protein